MAKEINQRLIIIFKKKNKQSKAKRQKEATSRSLLEEKGSSMNQVSLDPGKRNSAGDGRGHEEGKWRGYPNV